MSSAFSANMSKLGDKFSVLKQWTKEKVGKAEKTEESQAHQDMVVRFKATKIELEELQEAIRKWHKHQERALECFQTLSAATAKVTSSNAQTTTIVQQFVPFVTDVHTAHTAVVNSFKTGLYDPLEDINASEVKQVEKMLKRVDDARLAYDARNAAWKAAMDKSKPKQDEIDAAKQKVTDAENEYGVAQREFATACDHLEQRKQQLLQTQLPGFVQMQATYYTKSMEAAQRFSNRVSSGSPDDGKDGSHF